MRKSCVTSLRIASATLIALFATNFLPVLSTLTVQTAQATSFSKKNHASYWEDQGYGICKKIESPGGTSFTLSQPASGKQWSLLVVKASTDREIYKSPEAGTAYDAPAKSDGTVRDVSHVIYCYKKTSSTTPSGPVAVTAQTPPQVDLTCTSAGTYTIPSVKGVKYKVNHNYVKAATYTVSEPATVKVYAKAADGYVLQGTTFWKLVFTAPKNCDNVTPMPKPEKGKVVICHATASVKNPYNRIKVSISAVDGNLGNDNGNGDHYSEHTGPVFTATMKQGDKWGDIIPPITGIHAGLNWTAEGKKLYKDACSVAVTDVCPNISGNQATVPENMTQNDNGDCVVPTQTTPEDKDGDVLGEATQDEAPVKDTAAPAKLANTGDQPLWVAAASLVLLGFALLAYRHVYNKSATTTE